MIVGAAVAVALSTRPLPSAIQSSPSEPTLMPCGVSVAIGVDVAVPAGFAGSKLTSWLSPATHIFPSGPLTIPRPFVRPTLKAVAPAGFAGGTLITPIVVETQRLPSGPTATPKEVLASGNSVTVPSGLIWAMPLTFCSVTHMFPSGPWTMSLSVPTPPATANSPSTAGAAAAGEARRRATAKAIRTGTEAREDRSMTRE